MVSVAVSGAGGLSLGNTTGGINIFSYWSTLQNFTVKMAIAPITIIEME